MDGILNFLRRVPPDVIDQGACPTTNETLERISNAGNRVIIELHKAIREGHKQKEVEELRHVEAGATLRRCKSFLNAKPHEHDCGQRKYHVEAERVEGR